MMTFIIIHKVFYDGGYVVDYWVIQSWADFVLILTAD